MDQHRGTPADGDEPLGAVLARMRKAKRLSGGRLADLVGMSQPKISRIENGKGAIDPRDVGRIAEALGADDHTIRRLVERAENIQDRIVAWRPGPVVLAERQMDFQQLEASARSVRVFQPAVFVGLLQTSEYARAVLTGFQPLMTLGGASASPTSVSEAVSARLYRQQILADASKSFHFVMTESVLGNRICSPEAMLAQIRRVRDVARQPNIKIAFIPADTTLAVAPFNGFVLFDDRVVTVDLLNTGLASRARADLRLYQRVFEIFESCAVTDIGHLLDRYQRLYAELSLPRSS